MSVRVEKVLEELKLMTLLEASDLIKKIVWLFTFTFIFTFRISFEFNLLFMLLMNTS